MLEHQSRYESPELFLSIVIKANRSRFSGPSQPSDFIKHVKIYIILPIESGLSSARFLITIANWSLLELENSARVLCPGSGWPLSAWTQTPKRYSPCQPASLGSTYVNPRAAALRDFCHCWLTADHKIRCFGYRTPMSSSTPLTHGHAGDDALLVERFDQLRTSTTRELQDVPDGLLVQILRHATQHVLAVDPDSNTRTRLRGVSRITLRNVCRRWKNLIESIVCITLPDELGDVAFEVASLR